MFQGLAQGRAGDFDHALQGVVHLQNNKDRTRDGQCADEQHGNHGDVPRREQSKAKEQHSEPEEQHNEERSRERALRLLDQQPTGL